ncbi:MAG: ABC transporter ATP-binding protein [Chloroflexi bacterium]|nr:MAG: ABC transporter ATP-binding protein [Chloroflexota bacterium]
MAERSGDLVIEGLVKLFEGGVRAVDDVSITIREGEFVTLLGPSGCGKTTTLNCVAGLERPDAGRISVGDDVLTDVSRRLVLPPERRDLGMVFQSYALWPHMTVHDNLAYGLRLRKVPRAEIESRIRATLDLVELSGLEKRYPYQLSGGQQQRVALARAVVAEPRVLLLDEPLSNLDAKVRERARFWLPHDQAEALAISDRVAVMSAGRVLQYAPPNDIYERPSSRFVAEFIGRSSFLRGEVVRVGAGRAEVRLAGSGTVVTAAGTAAGTAPGDRVVLAVRSERIDMRGENAAENIVRARIKSYVYAGAEYEYILDTPEGELRASSQRAVSGPEVSLHLPPDAIVVLREEAAPLS